MSVAVQTIPTFTVGQTMRIPVRNLYIPNSLVRDHDITPDGKRRLIMVTGSGSSDAGKRGPQVNFVLNWFSEIERLGPASRN
jgi:hypothetical protein